MFHQCLDDCERLEIAFAESCFGHRNCQHIDPRLTGLLGCIVRLFERIWANTIYRESGILASPIAPTKLYMFSRSTAT